MPDGVLLDLGATAKALAADRAAAAIAAATGCGVLVNLGGDISVAGPPPEGGWLVGVADDAGFDTTTASVAASQVDRDQRRRARHVQRARPRLAARRRRGCTTSSTRAPGCPRGPAGARSPSPRRAAWTRTPPAPPRSCAASARARWLAGLGLPARLVRQDGTVVSPAGRLARGGAAGSPRDAIDMHGPGLWYVTRATGLVALVLLTVSVLLGLLTAGRFASARWPRFLTRACTATSPCSSWRSSRCTSAATVLDTYTSISLTAAFVPFASSYKPLWLALGAVALDLLSR